MNSIYAFNLFLFYFIAQQTFALALSVLLLPSWLSMKSFYVEKETELKNLIFLIFNLFLYVRTKGYENLILSFKSSQNIIF